ncbi:hypothetical protein AMTRI_Chr04g188060 [Amborella trichopoda]
MEKLGRQLSVQDWETIMEDFQSGPVKQEKWLALYPRLTILELALFNVLKKDFLLKSHLVVFMEEFSEILIPEADVDDGLGSVLEALRALVQAPVDGVSVTYALKEQMMVSATSVVIVADGLHKSSRRLGALAELLLTVINRPSYGVDRQTRGVACECLRELERAYPCLFYELSGHFWALCQSERTHCAQNYILLLTHLVHDIVCLMGNNSRSKPNSPSPLSLASSLLSITNPIVPFNVPSFLVASIPGEESNSIPFRELSSLNIKELRRVMAFLLERPQILTPSAMLEFVSMLIHVAVALELQVSLLKVQFFGLLYSYNPLLWHVVLMLYSHFSDAFDGEEKEIARRLVLISKEVPEQLVFRLLVVHWLLGLEVLSLERERSHTVVPMAYSFYPPVFDPLALKALKLDVLAYCAICVEASLSSVKRGDQQPGLEDQGSSMKEELGISGRKMFEAGLICVSSFKWLPPGSTETMVAFRMFHKFLIGAASQEAINSSDTMTSTSCTSFCTLQDMLVNTTLESRRLVPVIVGFIDRLMTCNSHRWLGECLLQKFDEQLLPKLVSDYQLTSYFPIFNRIAENVTIPPRGLLELLAKFLVTLVENHGPENGLKSWSKGSKVLGICRTILMYHHSSRIFLPLSHLLNFACQYFPDLEVRDNARIYLRMLLCIPGKKLRHVLNLGQQLPGDSSSPNLSTFFQTPSPRPPRDTRSGHKPSSYIDLNRVVPLIVKQSWSLAISNLGIEDKQPGYGDAYGLEPSFRATEIEDGSDAQAHEEPKITTGTLEEPLRVMDAKIAEILGILRRHFASIPDYRHMPGHKIEVPCTLRFDASSFSDKWEPESPNMEAKVTKELPALYAIVISFSSSSNYGLIPSVHIPFLLGQAPSNEHVSPDEAATDMGHEGEMIPLERLFSIEGNGFEEAEISEEEALTGSVIIELEPREPVPGLVNVSIEANIENGQTIHGQLQSITVGIEDMFLRSPVPSDVPVDAIPKYHYDLFHALWEACGNSSNTGRETFFLKGGKGVAAVNGTRSIKLLEVSFEHVVGAIERYLASFVVGVTGEPIVSSIKDNSAFKGIIVPEDELESTSSSVATGFPYGDSGPLQLKYFPDETDSEINYSGFGRRHLGYFLVLIFLPPRFHLLLQMEVCNFSTLVRIRTDHWPCLAYMDEYLEALTAT